MSSSKSENGQVAKAQSGKAQSPNGDKPQGGAAFDARLVRRLWDFIRPHQRLLWAGFGLLLVTNGFRLTLPFLMKIAIDDHLTPQEEAGFGVLMLAFAGLALGEYLTRRWQMYIVDLAGQNALYDLRARLFRHLSTLSSRFYDKTPTGRLVGRVTTDIEALQEMFSQGVVTILGDVVFLVATAWILLALNWKLTLVTFAVVPILLALTMFVRSRVRVAYIDLRGRLSGMNAYLHEQIAGMSVLQAFRREDASRDGFAEINDGVREAQLKTVKWESSLSALTDMLGSLTLAVILWYGGGLAVGALDPAAGGVRAALTLGTLFAFIDYMGRFFQPLNDLSLKYTVMQNAMTAADRIFALLDTDETIPNAAHSHKMPETAGKLAFRGVRFAYDPEKTVLRDLSFEVRAGERVAIVGATGAGKTTLLNLLTRLYDVDAGSIELDGVDLRELDLRQLRRSVGVVPQDVFLFEGDLLENIRLGHPEISSAEAEKAGRALGLDEVIERFPGGYHEPVRERGKNLSSGEKQLIAFARVLAARPPVLILDEATSNVDSHTESLLQAAVHRVMEGRTALIIAHRLSTIRDVDRILVFHRGELVEQGSHEELFRQDGVYRRLYELQYREQEEGGAKTATP